MTWLTGRHTVKFGGQLLHYNQRRFYAGNNGLLGIFTYGGAFTGFPFSDFLLDQVSQVGRGSSTDPWTQLHNRMALYVQDDFKLTPALTLNLGLRWAYTQPLVEKDNRQGNFDLTTGAEILAADGSRESRALYNSYKKGFEPRLGFAWRPSERWVVPRRLRHLAVHGRHRREPAAAAEPAVLLRVGGAVRLDDGSRLARLRLRRARAARSAVGSGARVEIRTCARSSRSSGTCSPSTC